MATETELKLTVTADDLVHLLKHPLLANLSRRKKLYNIYYDTPELALMKNAIAVRERIILRKTLLTVKLDQNKLDPNNFGGLSQRSEWEGPSTPGQFDFQTLIDDVATLNFLSQLTPQLNPIFTTDFYRRTCIATFRGAKIEVAIDQGLIVTKRAGSFFQEPICEVELELLEGKSSALFGLARVLSRRARLHPSSASKAQRGYDLYLDRKLGPIKPAAITQIPEASLQQTFVHINLECLTHLQVNDVGLLLDQDDEYIHQVRVAIRRIRVSLKLFAKILPLDFVSHWSMVWRGIAKQLDDARNWDVFVAELLPLIVRDLSSSAALNNLQEFVKTQRSFAHDQVIQYIGNRSYSVQVISYTEALLNLDVIKDTTVQSDLMQQTGVVEKELLQMKPKEFATKILQRRHRQLHKKLMISRHTSEQFHELRLELKKLRYAMDFFNSFYPAKKVSAYLKPLTKIQELLGQMNDMVSAQALLSTSDQSSFEIFTAWIKGRESGYFVILPRAIKGLVQLPEPWQK